MRSLCFWILVAGILGAFPGSAAVAQTVPLDLLVSSRNTNSVLRFDGETGAFVDALVRPGAGGLSATQEVLLGGDGDLLVTGRGNRAVLRFDRQTGEPRGAFSSGYVLDAPTKMSWGPDGDLYISQWGDRTGQTTVAVFDGVTGEFLREATPDLDRPMDHTWDQDGTLHVVSFGSRDVRRFEGGALIDVFVPASPRLQGPVNLWFQEGGDLVIADWTSGSIQSYDAADGSFIGTFVGGLQNVEGRATGPDGALYVGEWGADQVRRFDAATGAALGIFARGGSLGAPNSLLFVERLPDFSISIAPVSVTISSGGQAEAALQIRPVRGLPFNEEVALRCVSPSSRLGCDVEPAAVTPGSQPVTATVRLTAGTTTTASRNRRTGWPLVAIGPLMLGLVMRRRRPGRGMAPWGLALLLLVSCGGSGGSTTGPDPTPGAGGDPSPVPAPMPEIVQIELTAASGSIVRTSMLTVTIQ